jgi:hypothetical protein
MPIAEFSRIANALAVTLALSCAGCAGGIGGAWDMGRADHDADPPSQNESYVVLGVAPEYTQVNLLTGWIADGVFHWNTLPASFAGQPEDGFIVTRSSAGNHLALGGVMMFASKDDKLRPMMVPCEGAKTIVLTVPAGKVIYLGGVRYRPVGSVVVPQFTSDFDAAKAYMTAHYPKLADKLERGHFDFMPMASGSACAGR